MRLLVSFTALFLSVVFFQLGFGGLSALDALSGVALGFSPAEVGLLGSAHFVGYFIGCWWTPRLMGQIGHSRAYAALTSAGIIGILLHMMLTDPLAWAGLRLLSGIAGAGSYTIIEAWLQSKVTNATRGRAMGVYRVVDITGNLGAQLLIAVLPPAAYVSYNILAILCCAALIPLVLTRVTPPETGPAPRLRPRFVWALSPLAAVGVVVTGITGSAFRMIGPLYGLAVGLAADRIALFLAAYVVGGALAQIPVGWLADTFDRRNVMLGLSVAAIAACGLMAASGAGGAWAIYVAAGVFGATTMPIYSVAAAYANDFATQEERVDLSAALLFLYAAGAIASPMIAAVLIAWFGPLGMFGFLALSHLALLGFGLYRMRVRPAPPARTGFVSEPRTSPLIGRLLGGLRDRGPDDEGRG
jgi:MFS family permease